MTIAVAGLGRMGAQIARKLHEAGHRVIAHNRSAGPIDQMKALGMEGAYTKEETVAAFGSERPVLWLMVPSDVVDTELDAWLALLPKESLIIDGGNSDYRLTRERSERVAAAGMTLLDAGTSGGVWGYQNGFSMMVGGDKAAYETLTPALDALAAPEGAYRYFGPSGAGHFVKMTHNAIEYGIMESLAEGYRLLKEGPYGELDLAAAGEVWQHHSVITSWLNELSRDALRENPALEGIEGVVAESGEARWALETAKEYALPMPSIQASFDVRLASQKGEVNFATKLLAAMRNKFGG
ncbi:MAG TPA: NADP-dependent phosphogluconate dehydrogenase, partial [Candidatus Paceibacterota bacterium]